MLDKEKCREWASAMLAVIKLTKELSDDEIEYIKRIFDIEYAKLKIEELEAKNKK